MFEPFRWDLWLTMVLFAMIMSVVQAFVFQEDWRFDGWDEWRAARGPIEKLGVVMWQGGYRFARSLLDFMLGGIEEYPRTAPKMMLMLGCMPACGSNSGRARRLVCCSRSSLGPRVGTGAFFILISISAYVCRAAARTAELLTRLPYEHASASCLLSKATALATDGEFGGLPLEDRRDDRLHQGHGRSWWVRRDPTSISR